MGGPQGGAAVIAVADRLAELGLELPPPMRLRGQRFETVKVAGDRITIAGHLPVGADGKIAGPLGKVGADVSAEDATASARQVGLAMLASLEDAGVDLDRIEWRRAFGMVNAAPGFNALPGVINGFSELLLDVFGERGRHSRSAIGVAELPFGAPVEVEAEAALLPLDEIPASGPPSSHAPARVAEPDAPDPGLRIRDYASIHPLSIPAEALVRSIDSLSNLFWISIGGTVVTIFLAALTNLVGATGALPVGEFHIPVTVLPTACLAFGMFLLWLTASRLRMLLAALDDHDLTAAMARDIFRLDPPVLDVFAPDNLGRFAFLSGLSMLLWNWSLFFGASIALLFSATMLRGAAASESSGTAFLAYLAVTVAVMAYGARRVLPLFKRLLEVLHGTRVRLGPARAVVALLVVAAGIFAANPDALDVLGLETWRGVGPSYANAVDGETLLLEGGVVVRLVGIRAMRPGQQCANADGVPWPCGQRATAFLQSLVHDRAVACLVSYPNLGICTPLEDGQAPPTTLEETFTEANLAAQMVGAGLALAEGDAQEVLGQLQDEAQQARAGAWQGTFEPPSRVSGDL